MAAALRALAACIVVFISACSTLPSDGPSIGQIHDESEQGKPPPFELVDVSAGTIDELRKQPDTSFVARFGDDRPAPDLVLAPAMC